MKQEDDKQAGSQMHARVGTLASSCCQLSSSFNWLKAL